MTVPAVKPGPPWYVRPWVVLPAFVGVAVLYALFAEELVVGRTGDPRLTTYSTQPQGAALFADLATKLGWRIVRRREPTLSTETGVIHAVLAPAQPPRAEEVEALFERVEAGDALLLVLSGDADPFAGALDLDVAAGHPVQSGAADCEDPSDLVVRLWPGRPLLYGLRWTAPPPDSVVEFVTLSASADDEPEPPGPAVIGFPWGRGRIVVASDPDFLRNDALRVCSYGLDVRAVRALEYLRDGGDRPRATIVFDEYHHGYGEQPGTMGAMASYLSGTPSGRFLFQMVGAGLVLLFALAPRAIAPVDPERIERRSPLEHVDALARAYAQVGGTRTATAHLLRGVRRRVQRGALRARSARTDEAFLDRVSASVPARSADAALVRRALAERVSKDDLGRVGDALDRIEASLTRT